jgi:hypothetical protein
VEPSDPMLLCRPYLNEKGKDDVNGNKEIHGPKWRDDRSLAVSTSELICTEPANPAKCDHTIKQTLCIRGVAHATTAFNNVPTDIRV